MSTWCPLLPFPCEDSVMSSTSAVLTNNKEVMVKEHDEHVSIISNHGDLLVISSTPRTCWTMMVSASSSRFSIDWLLSSILISIGNGFVTNNLCLFVLRRWKSLSSVSSLQYNKMRCLLFTIIDKTTFWAASFVDRRKWCFSLTPVNSGDGLDTVMFVLLKMR